MAAQRGGITTVIFPAENKKDLRDIPKSVRRALEVVPVDHMDDVLCNALRLEDPAAFRERLTQPLLPPDLSIQEGDIPGVVAEPKVH